MAFCSENLTIGISKTSKKLIRLEKNRIQGIAGIYLQKLVENKGSNRCTFRIVEDYVGIPKVGNPEDPKLNQSFNYLFKQNQLDFYFAAVNLGLVDENLETSHPIRILEYQVAQIIEKTEKIDRSDLLSFLVDNKLLLIIVLIGYLMIFLVITILIRTVYKKIRKKIQLISYELFFYDLQKIRSLFPKIALIFIFFNCFILINLSLLTNSIKTDVIAINTDEFIDSQSKLDRTKRIPIVQFSIDNRSTAIAKIKKRAILFKLDNIQNATKLIDKKITSYYFIMSKLWLYTSIYHLCLDCSKLNYYAFKKEINYHDSFKVFYYRKSLQKDKKKKLKKRLIDSYEKGLTQKMFTGLENDLYDLAKSRIKIYFNLDNFISELVKLNGQTMVYENYATLFYLFYSIQLSILIWFLINSVYRQCFKYLVEFCKKQINLFKK